MTVPDGWTPKSWTARLRQLAALCRQEAADFPSLLPERERQAAAFEAQANLLEASYDRTPDSQPH